MQNTATEEREERGERGERGERTERTDRTERTERTEQRPCGRDHWDLQRKEWNQHQTHKHSNLDIHPNQLDAVYHSLIQGKKFTKPMPLAFVIKILNHGWANLPEHQ